MPCVDGSPDGMTTILLLPLSGVSVSNLLDPSSRFRGVELGFHFTRLRAVCEFVFASEYVSASVRG